MLTLKERKKEPEQLFIILRNLEEEIKETQERNKNAEEGQKKWRRQEKRKVLLVQKFSSKDVVGWWLLQFF